MNKSIINILFPLFTGGIVIYGAIKVLNNRKEAEIPINVSINIDKDLKENIEVYINPHGYELANFRPIEYVGNTNLVYPLLINNEVQKTNFKKISEFSDYYIYAKYKDSYALIRTTNTIVLGSSKTNIELRILDDKEERPFITVLKGIPIYQSNPNGKIALYSYFYDKSEYQKIHDKSEEMLNALENIKLL